MKDCAMTIDIYESITTRVPEDIRTEIEQITASAAAQNPPVNIFSELMILPFLQDGFTV